MTKTEHAIGTCKTCKITETIQAPFGYGPLATRAKCGHLVRFFSVVGNHRADVTCGGKCLSAKRAACECSCAGANHGKGWAA